MRALALLVISMTLGFLGSCSEQTPSPTRSPVDPKESCNIRTALTPGIPGSPGHLITSERNPNGDSELAVLMREMLSDLQDIRNDVLARRTITAPPKAHHRMLCVWPSETEIRSPVFEALASEYTHSLEPTENKVVFSKDAFNQAVSGCLTCHNTFCPGPIHLIEALWIE